jgi:hypothetical protein
MSLAKIVEEEIESKAVGGLPCLVGKVLASEALDKEDKKFFTEQVTLMYGDANYISSVILAKALSRLGAKINEKAIRTHRLGQCNCGKKINVSRSSK